MQIPLVMTIIGPDRTGLVESVARVVAEHGGNWLESRMCRLGGEFAGLLRIEIPAEKKSPLLAALQELQKDGLQHHHPRRRVGCPFRRPAGRRSWKLSAATGPASSAKSPARSRGRT